MKNNITPSEYNSLPENEKHLWEQKSRYNSDWERHEKYYIPVTINLSDAERIVQEAIDEMEHSAVCQGILTFALTKLKELIS